MGNRILLHRKYGVNPTMTQCYFCNEVSEILLVGTATKQFKDAGFSVSEDGEMPHTIGILDGRPCPKCEGYMKQGVIFISVRDDQEQEIKDAHIEKRLPNPYRTGGWNVMSEEWVNRVFVNEEIKASVLKTRVCFVPDLVWDAMGLPRGDFPPKEDGEEL